MEGGFHPVPSLTGLAASSLNLSRLSEVCSSPSFANSDICSWRTWRERAYLELAVPYDYFDNCCEAEDSSQTSSLFPLRKISGYSRYVEIVSKFRLIPESIASLDEETGIISGIYEPYAGILQAVKRNDLAGIDLFLPLLNDEQRSMLMFRIEDHRVEFLIDHYRFAAFEHLVRSLFGNEAERVLTAELEEDRDGYCVYQPPEHHIVVEQAEKNKADDGSQIDRNIFPNKQEFLCALNYLISQGCRFALTQALSLPPEEFGETQERQIALLIWTLKSGQLDMLERVVPLCLDLPIFGRSVLEIASGASQNVQVEIADEYFDAVYYGGNPLFLKFLLAINQGSVSLPIDIIPEAYFTRRNPVGYYELMLQAQFDDTNNDYSELGDIDINLGTTMFFADPDTTFRDKICQILSNSMGNVSILQTYLPIYKKVGGRQESLPQSALHPLSSWLIQQTYQNN